MGEGSMNCRQLNKQRNCIICKTGQLNTGPAMVTLHRGEATVIIKGVLALVCDNCGGYYLDEATATKVLRLADEAVKRGAEVEIVRWAA